MHAYAHRRKSVSSCMPRRWIIITTVTFQIRLQAFTRSERRRETQRDIKGNRETRRGRERVREERRVFAVHQILRWVSILSSCPCPSDHACTFMCDVHAHVCVSIGRVRANVYAHTRMQLAQSVRPTHICTRTRTHACTRAHTHLRRQRYCVALVSQTPLDYGNFFFHSQGNFFVFSVQTLDNFLFSR